ncbi:ABC transporter permease [Marinobacteraceae bacterium S3BR75-40.1]
MNRIFSLARLWAIVRKEFVQMRRDRLTFAMMVGIPIIQLALFGFAINTDPKHLPTAVRSADHSAFSHALETSLRHSDYFDIVARAGSEAEGQALLAAGEVQFVLSIPADFSHRLLRGEQPQVLLEADATDPAATSNALAALSRIEAQSLTPLLRGPLADLQGDQSTPFEFVVHRRYNPEGVTQYNIVPGLMGVILTMTMVVMTALAVTREHERGTMENLLAMPIKPLEVMVGKIVPYIFVGFVQVAVILAAARWVFHVPMLGSMVLLVAGTLLFIIANLTVGITFSSVARNQAQAMQMSIFFFLPSILLSGFMFPFRGMPLWARYLGEGLPLTHFLRFVRGLLLKGNGWELLWPHIWPLLVFMVVVMLLGLLRYRRTLD